MKQYTAILAALILGACATTASTQVSEGKAIANTWALFDGATLTLDNLAKADALNQSEKDTIARDGARIRDLLNSATTAVNNDDNATAQQNVVIVTSLIAELTTIITTHHAGSK